MNLFGFKIGKDVEKKVLPSIVPPHQEDGSIEVGAGGSYGTYIDLEGQVKNEAQLVTKYREMAIFQECDIAIQDIVNEAIIIDNVQNPVEIVLDDIKGINENLKKKIRSEFEGVLELLDFSNNAYDLFKKWYVDGRLYHHLVVDPLHPRQGIQDIRYIDPRKIRKVREQESKKDPKTGAMIFTKTNEYYMFNPRGVIQGPGHAGAGMNAGSVRLAPDSISFVHSGIMDTRNAMIYSNLHKAIKPLNQLRMLEDAVVVYRLSRAPERRIFYIDVGNLPKLKAEQYLRDMMAKHKNKLTYDATTGEVRDDRRFQTMLEDFWLPRREGGKGTEITTLPGGQNLGEIEDVEYFRRRLYKSLNVPITRLDSENSFNLGRGSEITRDEIKFSKFIKRLRSRFAMLFNSILEIQLSLKGIISRAEWREIAYSIKYDYQEDNHYTELKAAEILQGRLALLAEAEQYVGKYFSTTWVKDNILHMTEEESDTIAKEIKEEGSDEEYENRLDPGDNGAEQEDNERQFPVIKGPEDKESPLDTLDSEKDDKKPSKKPSKKVNEDIEVDRIKIIEGIGAQLAKYKYIGDEE